MAGTTVNAVVTELMEAPKRSVNIETAAAHNKLVDDAETIRAAAAGVNTLLNQVRALLLNLPLGNPGFVIVSNFDVKNGAAFSYLNAGTLKTMAVDQVWDTGTAATIATVRWGVAVLTIDASGTRTVTWFTASGAGYASEAAAIAAITAPTSTHTVLGYVTVLAAGATWTAGTDALAGGTGGTPATTTNYYNLINPNTLLLGAALTTTTIDTAGDLTAPKVADLAGTVIA